MMASTKVNKRGAIVLPAKLRRRFGIVEGTEVVAEAREDGILIRPASPAIEIYTPERKAEFILGSAIDATDYALALQEVRALGLDPEKIPHHKPAGV
jgi:AbrB family looped-hinge helix DNA binding protein